jgi:hypothetical protein
MEPAPVNEQGGTRVAAHEGKGRAFSINYWPQTLNSTRNRALRTARLGHVRAQKETFPFLKCAGFDHGSSAQTEARNRAV